jgi:ABC-2 type transport system ATP-binding protein
MRTLLRDFADQGGTVLLSSYLLHEVSATADHLVVISGGAVVAAGRLDFLGNDVGRTSRERESWSCLFDSD